MGKVAESESDFHTHNRLFSYYFLIIFLYFMYILLYAVAKPRRCYCPFIVFFVDVAGHTCKKMRQSSGKYLIAHFFLGRLNLFRGDCPIFLLILHLIDYYYFCVIHQHYNAWDFGANNCKILIIYHSV